jgi:E3 ubiquitin-protein ligase MYCBP2
MSIPVDVASSPESSPLSAKVTVFDAVETQTGGCVATDGAFVYILSASGLFKLGTGLRDTVFAYEYASNASVRATAGCWLCCAAHSLYLRRRHSSRITVLNSESLSEVGEMMLPTAISSGTLVGSGGRRMHCVTLDAQWTLAITELDADTFAPTTQPVTQINLCDSTHVTFGELTTTSDHALLDCALVRNAASVHMAKEYAMLLTRTGLVYYTGRASVIGLDDVLAQHKWTHLAAIGESVKCLHIGLDSNNVVLLTISGVCRGCTLLIFTAVYRARIHRQRHGLHSRPITANNRWPVETTADACSSTLSSAHRHCAQTSCN